MLNKIASLLLVATLVTGVCGTSASADTSSTSNPKTDRAEAQLPFISVATEESAADERLRINMLRLVAEAKAGKVAPTERPQIQPAGRNNLSKGKKIAIGVVIAVAVIAVIVIVKSPALNDGR